MFKHYRIPDGKQVDESDLGKVVVYSRQLPSLNHNKGLSNAYALLLGFLGICMAGFAMTILDEVGFNHIWSFAISQQLNGTYLNIFSMMWKFTPVVVVFSFLLGIIIVSHKSRNEV